MIRIFCLLALLCPAVSFSQTNSTTLPVYGKVVSTDNTPLAGVDLVLQKSKHRATTGVDGNFRFESVDLNDTLIVRLVGYQAKHIPVAFSKGMPVQIILEANTNALEEVTVSTGYQDIPKERATGSFVKITHELVNRSVTTGIIDRLENITPGLSFNRQQVAGAAAPDPLLIRGRGTIYANAAPLIVLDNFPYDGDLNNINPNDVETVTILKDAAAASIWGARAGNGVIVITTKKGHSARPTIEFTSNTTFQQRPQINNISKISAPDYIELEKFLYGKGFYNSDIANTTSHPPLTPVVELLAAKANGSIAAATADAQIESYKSADARNDISKYLYRPGLNQQYALAVSGNTGSNNYYLSGGYDRNLSTLVGQLNQRVSLRSQNSFRISKKLQVDAGLLYTQSIASSGNNPGYSLSNGAGKALYPYARLVDNNNTPVTITENYRDAFAQGATAKGLADWSYNPITDIGNEDNTTKTSDFLINTALRYQLNNSFSAEIKYQFENSLGSTIDMRNPSSFFARNLLNQFTQVNATTGVLSFPLPAGGIQDISNSSTISNQGRVQFNYQHTWRGIHDLTAIAGSEVRELDIIGNQSRQFGYQPDRATIIPNIDYVTQFPLYNNLTQKSQIPLKQSYSSKTDRFVSYYANAAYSFRKKYILSGSARRDEANLFGVSANQKGTPLMSVGAGWLLSDESFYHSSLFPKLKLRATYGSNGNVSRLTSAYTTAKFSTAFSTPAIDATISSPPNEKLRWEKVKIWNFGLDAASKNNTVTASIEYYHKNATDLMGQAPVDPSSGLIVNGGVTSLYYGNVAAMTGNGWDMEISSHNLRGKLGWTTTLIGSYASSLVTNYLLPATGAASTYMAISGSTINPVIGKPVYAVFSYAWAGLDPVTGDPMGFLAGSASKNYTGIANNKLDSVKYNGNVLPLYTASLRNTFNWKHISLSFIISYKGGYYFRRPSIIYGSLFSNWTGTADYSKRWQQAGDENHTSVPSLVYPAVSARDNFYQYAEVLVEKADNIRLEDINLAYDLDKSNWSRLPFPHLRVYLYVSNAGLLWTANKQGIDPNYIGVPKESPRVSLGVNINF